MFYRAIIIYYVSIQKLYENCFQKLLTYIQFFFVGSTFEVRHAAKTCYDSTFTFIKFRKRWNEPSSFYIFNQHPFSRTHKVTSCYPVSIRVADLCSQCTRRTASVSSIAYRAKKNVIIYNEKITITSKESTRRESR